MPETPEIPKPEPRILEIRPSSVDPSLGNVMVIDSDAKAADIIATLEDIEPDQLARLNYLYELLRIAIEENGGLANKRILLSDERSNINDQVTLETSLKFGDKPNTEDLILGLSQVYAGEEAIAPLNRIFHTMVEEGFLADVELPIVVGNEITNASPETIKAEMEELTRQYGSDS